MGGTLALTKTIDFEVIYTSRPELRDNSGQKVIFVTGFYLSVRFQKEYAN